MSIVNVGDLTREALEDIVLAQSVQLKILLEANEALKAERQRTDTDYEELARVVLQARAVLSC